jgi:hypothetical protein
VLVLAKLSFLSNGVDSLGMEGKAICSLDRFSVAALLVDDADIFILCV